MTFSEKEIKNSSVVWNTFYSFLTIQKNRPIFISPDKKASIGFKFAYTGLSSMKAPPLSWRKL